MARTETPPEPAGESVPGPERDDDRGPAPASDAGGPAPASDEGGPAGPSGAQPIRGPAVLTYEAVFAATIVVVVGGHAITHPGEFADPALIGWALAVAAMDLMPVQGPGQAQLSLSFPILLAAALVYPPPVAAALAAVGSIDQREIKLAIPVLKAVFVRSEVALSVLCAGAVFHALAPIDSRWYLLIPAVLAAVATDYVVNTTVVAAYMALSYRTRLREVYRGLHVGTLYVFVLSYMGLGLFAALMAVLYEERGAWLALLFFGPLLLARQMFFRTRELERTTQELRSRQDELQDAFERLRRLETERRRLLDHTVEATEDERRRIAAALHDGPIQHLAAIVFRLENLRTELTRGEVLSDMASSVAQTQDDLRDEVIALRRLITQLRPPVLDHLGLEDALREHLESVRLDSGLDFTIQLGLKDRLDTDLETVAYRVSQEALTNVVKHADARHVWVLLEERDDIVVLEVGDDGVGFYPERRSALGADGHVGLIAMRERVEGAGGTWVLSSAPGEGTLVRSLFPRHRGIVAGS
jgi:two-component system sensor histidine kinase UhpB